MKNISAVGVAFTYVGTIVGAGFASGQEIKKYFADFGLYGLAGICLMAFLFFYLGKKIMMLCEKNNIETYDKLLNLLANKKIAIVFDFFITIFLVGTLTTMGAGMGAILKQVFNIPVWFGSVLLILLSVFVVKKGINEISKLNVLIVPILIIVTIIISITAFSGFDNVVFVQDNNVGKSIFSAILYVAYNLIMSISILPALAISTDKKQIEKGMWWGSIIIGGLSLLIYIALLSNYGIIQNVEIPLAILSNKFIGFYMVAFLLEVFSTAIGALYGVYSRVNKNNMMLYIISICAYLFSLFGFSNLVTYLYGVMGVIGVLMIFILLRRGEYK